jgi:hypothetical protein
MSRRRHKRIKRRIPCELTVGSQSFQGIVLDLSPMGLFVQTSASLENAGEVVVTMVPEAFPRLMMRARVARVRRVPPGLANVVPPGIGLEILEAPPEFAYLARGEKLPEPDPPGPLSRFRVRLVDPEGYGHRTMIAEAVDEEDLRGRVLREALEIWRIERVEPL